MAVLHNKEEKIRAVVGRLPKKYTDEDFVSMFIKLYSKDWGKIKSAYIKQSQDKAPGTVINMPKPDLYLKQLLTTYLQQSPAKEEIAAEVVAKKDEAKVVKTAKAPVKKKEAKESAPIAKAVKAKVAVKKKAELVEVAPEVVEKPKTTVKKKVTVAKEKTTTEKKVKTVKKAKEI